MTVYIINSNLVERLKEPVRRRYSGDCEYTLLMIHLTSAAEEPSFRVLSADELREETGALGKSMSLNGFRYRGVNEQFLEILQSVATDYRWCKKPHPHGISDVDKHILMYVRKS